jgi:anaerobic ribonucleoside-triphosphate reductase
MKGGNMSPTTVTDKKKSTLCEVYSRIVGYLRPVAQWNDGKASEFKKRKVYKVKD